MEKSKCCGAEVFGPSIISTSGQVGYSCKNCGQFCSLATEEKKECGDCGRPLDGENCPAFGVHDAAENRGEEKKCKHIDEKGNGLWIGQKWQPETQKCSRCGISWRDAHEPSPLPPKENWEEEFDKLMDGVRCPIKGCGDEECIKIGLLAFIRSLLAAEKEKIEEHYLSVIDDISAAKDKEKKKEPSPLPPKENWEEIIGAVARGWTYPLNTHKTFDSTLAIGIAKEVLALLQKEKEEAYKRGKKMTVSQFREAVDEEVAQARSTALDECIAKLEAIEILPIHHETWCDFGGKKGDKENRCNCKWSDYKNLQDDLKKYNKSCRNLHPLKP